MGNETFVFDTDSTFYCISDFKNKRQANRNFIKGTKWFYGAFSIKYIGSKFYAIYFGGYYPKRIYSRMLREAGIDPDNEEEVMEGMMTGNAPDEFHSKSLIYDFETDSIIVEDLKKKIK